MYIEIINDLEGKIVVCGVFDVLPRNIEDKYLRMTPFPSNSEQCRIEISLQEAMKIEYNCGQQAIIVNGKAEMINIDRSTYIRENYKVDMDNEISKTIEINSDLKIRKIIRNKL